MQEESSDSLASAFAAVRARLGLIALLFAIAGAGWWSTVDRMRGMDDGPWTELGTFGWFLGVWVVMMAAMMFPSVAPTVALYSRMIRRRSCDEIDGREQRRRYRRGEGPGRSRSRLQLRGTASLATGWPGIARVVGAQG